MTIAAGDHESVMSEGLGHSGGTLPDFTESQTRGHWAGAPVVEGQLVHYAVQIDMTDLTTDTDAARGLYAGFFRWVTERPQYDGITVVPTGENEGDVWKEGILIGRDQLSPVDRIGDFNKGGDYASLSGFNWAIDNTSDFGAAVVGFDDYLAQNGYEIINRPVKFYCVIDDVFYQIWGGVLSKPQYNEKIFEGICKDIFERIHKPMPPSSIVLQKFPDADPDNLGKNIPIVFGDVLRTELLNVTGKTEAVQIGISVATLRPAVTTGAEEYNVDGSDRLYLKIVTPYMDFPADYFVNTGVYFLTVIKGEAQSVRIIGNDATVNPSAANSTTIIRIAKRLSVDISTFNTDHAYPSVGSVLGDGIWFFQLFQFDTIYLFSDKAVNTIFQDETNSLQLTRWNKDKLRYDPIPELLEAFDNSENNIYEAPFMSLLNNDIDLEGDFIRLISINPDSIRLLNTEVEPLFGSGITNEFETGDYNLLLDKDRTTKLSVERTGGGMTEIVLKLEVTFPENFVFEDLTELFLCIDWELELVAAPSGVVDIFQWRFTPSDPLEKNNYASTNYAWPVDITADLNLNALPNEYYNEGDDNGEDSDFNRQTSTGQIYSDWFIVPDIESFGEAQSANKIELRFRIRTDSISNEDIKRFSIKQIGFMGNQKMNVIKDVLFVKTRGEEVGAVQTNNVYRAIQHILETYDEISSSEIDYGNLETGSRDDWRVGRQVKDRKLSAVYLKELAAQGFVGIYPDRRGRRHTKSFLDDVANVWTHAEDNGTIIKGSISRFEATPINEVYNDFAIEYDWNPGLKRFNKTIFVTNTDARTEPDPYNATFPSENESTGNDQSFANPADWISMNVIANLTQARIFMTADPASWASVGGKVSFDSGSGSLFSYATIIKVDSGSNYVDVEIANPVNISVGFYTSGTITGHGSAFRKWPTWVGGISDYGTAKGYWEICYNSWLKTQTVNKFPAALSKCYWYPDGAVYDGTGESDDGSAAHLYLENLISWVTRQKFRTVYEIPVSKTNITVDQLDVVKFKDQKYTNGDFLTGYIEKVKINPRTDRIELEAILRPTDLEVFPPGAELIIETGTAPKTYTELGNAPKTITEQGTP